MKNFAKCLLMLAIVLSCTQLVAAEMRIGVVDHTMLGQDNWTAEWKDQWQSEKIAERFRAAGLKADVIGADILLNPSVLANYGAIIMPTDECYPDDGAMNGPISRNIADFVRLGGIYIMPIGASHCRWRDIRTGKITPAYGTGGEDFLGLMWEMWGDHTGAGPALVLTGEGKRVGVPTPSFDRPMNTHCRGVGQPAIVYASNKENQRCLYALGVGKGSVIHYAGGMPLDAQLCNWLIGSYAAILKSGGPDAEKLNREVTLAMRNYGVYPISTRAVAGKQSSVQMSLDGDWELTEAQGDFSGDLGGLSGTKWTKVHMPDSIHGAMFRAGLIEDPWYGENWKILQWISDRDWYLRKSFSLPDNFSGKHVRLRFDGANYKCALWVDGNYQGIHEGMFGGPTVDISNLAASKGKHEIVVRLMRPADGDVLFRSHAMSGTDMWANKYRTVGIYQPVRVVATGRAYLEAPYVKTEKVSGASATLWAQALLTNTADPAFQGVINAVIVDLTTGKPVWKQTYRQSVPRGTSYWERRIEIKNPRLWWPNGMGAQSLYRMEISLADDSAELDAIGTRFGIRTLELVRNPYLPDKPRSNPGGPNYLAAKPTYGPGGSGWNRPDLWSSDNAVEDDGLHNSDESYKFLFVVNGKQVYGKGVCWMTSDDTLSILPQRENWLIDAAKNAGINLFRLNGGNCLFETEGFYNKCDETGIMVWQDLPKFCWSRGTQVPLITWREQMKQSVLRLRQHASLAVYVGGNEFAPYVEALAPYLGMAREIIASYDNRPFRMASPAGGTYHAYYSPSGSFEDLWNGDPNWYVRYFDESVNFVSEWSYVCYANMSLLKRTVPAAELNDSEPVGFDSLAFLQKHPTIYSRLIEPDRIRDMLHAKASYYGNLEKTNLSQFIEYSQMSHGEIYGYVFEHWRSQLPYKGGETVWTYNSHGPSSSWSIIDWFGQPQVAYYSIQRAHEPVHVMADTHFFSWGPGDRFTANVFALNDGFQALKKTTIKARVLDTNMNEVASKSWTTDIPALGKKSAATEIGWQIPPTTPAGFFFLELTLSDASCKRLSRQCYNLRIMSSLADPEARKRWQAGAVKELLTKTGPWLQPELERSKTDLDCRLISVKARGTEAIVALKITNTGSKPAYPVRLTLNRDGYSYVWSDNYFWLTPGETVTISGTVKLNMTGIDVVQKIPVANVGDLSVVVSSWNAPGKTVRLAQ
ncbi:MAG: sugar-binding domain-containing protein [Armatimonadota bacterium]